MEGFKISESGKGTKGIWMWSRPIETVVVSNEKEIPVSCLILDYQGSDEKCKKNYEFF